MFEPVHESASDIAGQGIYNPDGAIGGAALVLEHFGLLDESRCRRVIACSVPGALGGRVPSAWDWETVPGASAAAGR